MLVGGAWMRTWILLALMVPVLQACSNKDMRNFPLEPIPLNVGLAGARAASDFFVKREQLYAVDLTYKFRDQEERGIVMAAARPGAAIKISIAIFRREENGWRPVVDQNVSMPKISSYGAEDLNSELLAVRLVPGEYRLRAETLIGLPTFSSVDTTIRVVKAYRGK